MTEPRPFFPKEFVAHVARQALVKPEAVLSHDRCRYLLKIRAVLYVLMRERGISYLRIAKVFNRDHTTVLHAVRTFDRYNDDEWVQALLRRARRYLTN